jgi:hypothetical protein
MGAPEYRSTLRKHVTGDGRIPAVEVLSEEVASNLQALVG